MERTVMASALASPPPPWSFGASDLKRNARKFLERALVISALVHLAAVGAFRAAYERSRVPEATELVPGWKHIVEVGPQIIPLLPPGIVPPSSTEGEIVMTKRVDPIDPNVIDYRVALPGNGVGPEANPGGSDRTDGSGGLLPPPPETTHAFKVVETPPVPIYAPLPVYPDFAREAGIEGRVIVRVLVGTDGLPKQVVAVSGPKLLFAAAEDGVRRWRFNPGMSAGEPLQVSVEVPVVFTLQ
jgi:protein TonB